MQNDAMKTARAHLFGHEQGNDSQSATSMPLLLINVFFNVFFAQRGIKEAVVSGIVSDSR